MKIMATFDGSAFAEAIVPLLDRLAALPGAEFVLFCAADPAHGVRAAELKRPAQAVGFGGQGSQPMAIGQAEPSLVATKEQATDAMIGEVRDYLSGIGNKLPGGASFTSHAEIDKDAAAAIVRAAEKLSPDVIVMATHGHTGLLSRFADSVTEKVIESGVAPVLVVHPEDVKKARKG
jgi:nucleotide-binding universal stress UspA family protein